MRRLLAGSGARWMSEFLGVEELRRLPEEWYRLVREVERLREFREVGEARGHLEGIAELAGTLAKTAKEVCISAMHHSPGLREVFESAMGEMERAAEEVRTLAAASAEVLRRAMEAERELRRAEAELEEAERLAAELERRAEKACDEAERLGAEVRERVAKIREETDAELVEIREVFAGRIAQLVGGRGLRVYGRRATPAQVLEELIREPEAEVVVEGYGREIERALRRLAQECAGRMRAVLLKEKQRVGEVKAGTRVEEAERECRRLREEHAGELERVEELRARVRECRGELSELGEVGYARVLELREELLGILEGCTLRRRVFQEIERLRPVVEEDPEKRDLRARIGELEGELERERERAERLRRELEQALRRAEETAREAEVAREEREGLKVQVERLRGEVEQAVRREEGLREEMEELRKVMKREQQAAARRESELMRMLEEARSRAKELEERLEEARAELERLASEKRRVERLLEARERVERRKEERGEEEAYLSEKLSALRRRR